MPAGPGVIMLCLMSPGTFMGLGVPGARPSPAADSAVQRQKKCWLGMVKDCYPHVPERSQTSKRCLRRRQRMLGVRPENRIALGQKSVKQRQRAVAGSLSRRGWRPVP